jgi:predicted nuclease of restriction endonuclease-like (RecB) superfamily
MTKKRSHSENSHPTPVREVTVRAGEFNEVLAMIEDARRRAYQAVNAQLVGLYWQMGEYISRKIESAEWGDSVVDELAAAIARRYPGLRGYTRASLFRMRQFYEAYRSNEKVAPLVRQLPWTHHLIILGRAKPPEAREFYILAAIQQRWTKRELERQVRSGAAFRAAPRGKKVSAALTQIHPAAEGEFRDACVLEFLGLPNGHSEADLHGALLQHLGHFITELGRVRAGAHHLAHSRRRVPDGAPIQGVTEAQAA